MFVPVDRGGGAPGAANLVGKHAGSIVIEIAGAVVLRWSRLFGQFFRFDEWNICRG